MARAVADTAPPAHAAADKEGSRGREKGRPREEGDGERKRERETDSLILVAYDTFPELQELQLQERVVTVQPYRRRLFRIALLWIFGCLSGGVLLLFALWFRRWTFRWTHRKCFLHDATHLRLVTADGGKHEVKVTRVPFSQSLVNAVLSPGGRSKRLPPALGRARLSSLGAKDSERRDTSHAATAERRGQTEKTSSDERNARGGDICVARRRSNSPSRYPKTDCPEQGDSDDADGAPEPPHTWAWMFEYRFIRYILEAPGSGGHNARGPLPASSTFKPLTFNVCFPPDQLRRQFLNSPPTRDLVRLRQGLFGSSSIRVEVPSLTALVLRDIVHPFYVFQLLAVALWFFDDYVQYAIAILLITSVSTGAECLRTRHNLLRLRDLAAQRCSVVAYRVTGENEGVLGGQLCDEAVSGGNATQREEGEQQPGPLRDPEQAPASSVGAPQDARSAADREKEREGTRGGDGEEKRNAKKVVREEVDSADLVVGDIFEVTIGSVLPCDAIVLRGTIVVTESCLTGESFPIIKTPLPEGRTDGEGDAERGLNLEQAAKHQLFAGTKVLSVRVPPASSPSSSASSSPGSSVASPADAPRALAAVCRVGYATTQGRTFRRLLFKSAVRIDFERDALKFVGILAVLAAIGGIFTLVISILHSLPKAEIAFRMFDLFTAAVPPALPASMSVGLSVAVTRSLGRFSSPQMTSFLSPV
ncbi:putative cation-transporting ATPase [Toxoplasma gondii GAB2-2007-GAL-DOM2]|uniref:Cation-transporting ATPase n=1 Tax=Toxoplasma gondii GAB2-2007-GAL-DOM2 TaxID=1130820 RepID=A0A086KTI0_TOXGO|nr:putative cation-transporting ATPase [Toxoplasma gondii GAB2-2007-GAL-DOM2]